MTAGLFRDTKGSFSEFWARQEPFLARGPGRVLTRGRQVGKARREGQVARGEGPAARGESPVKRGETARTVEIERRITEQEAEKRKVETDITTAFAQGDHQLGRRLAGRLARVTRMLDELYEEWERMAK